MENLEKFIENIKNNLTADFEDWLQENKKEIVFKQCITILKKLLKKYKYQYNMEV